MSFNNRLRPNARAMTRPSRWSLSPPWSWSLWSTLLLPLLLLMPLPAAAQIHLPPMPGLPGLPGAGRLPGGDLLRRTDDLLRTTTQTLLPADPLRLRERLSDGLLRRYPDQLQRNAAGELVFIGELLASPSSPAAREGLLKRPGLTLVEETVLDGVGLSSLRLRLPAASSPSMLAALIDQLRAQDPEGAYDFHHVYVGAGTIAGPNSGSGSGPGVGTDPALEGNRAALRRVGMIDSGVDAAHPALRRVSLSRHGCAGEAHPAAHGTAVASLLVGDDGEAFRGAVPGARLFAVDAYCEGGKQAGGGVLAIADGLSWLARERVGVVNISLVGPPNAVLRRVIEVAQSQGQLIVAPVGNDGPGAPPLYPAAWPGVVAVTGVDARRRVLAEAGRGPHVAFAAPGADMVAAEVERRGYTRIRGTSFASPLVAGLLAARLPTPDRLAAQNAVNALAREALDLGESGRDDVYGIGLVGAALRVPP